MPANKKSKNDESVYDIKVSTDRYCTTLTHRVTKYEPTENNSENPAPKYAIYDYCQGTKVVTVCVGINKYKFHDGCLKRISYELAKMAEHSDTIRIDHGFEPATFETAVKHILTPGQAAVSGLTSTQKYDLVLFGARYGLPPRHMSKLIDHTIYPDLVQYAWEKSNTYLMTMLPKMRIPEVKIAEDFLRVDDNIRLQFVRKYLEYEYLLKKFRRIKCVILVSVFAIWFFLLYCSIMFDDWGGNQ